MVLVLLCCFCCSVHVIPRPARPAEQNIKKRDERDKKKGAKPGRRVSTGRRTAARAGGATLLWQCSRCSATTSTTCRGEEHQSAVGRSRAGACGCAGACEGNSPLLRVSYFYFCAPFSRSLRLLVNTNHAVADAPGGQSQASCWQFDGPCAPSQHTEALRTQGPFASNNRQRFCTCTCICTSLTFVCFSHSPPFTTLAACNSSSRGRVPAPSLFPPSPYSPFPPPSPAAAL